MRTSSAERPGTEESPLSRITLPLIAITLLLTAPLALAGEHTGVSMDDSVTLQGQSMQLQGMGLRTVFRFKVYVAGLYMAAPTSNAGTVVASNKPQAIRLHMLRTLSSEKVGASIEDGFAKNSAAALPALQGRLDQLKAMFPSVTSGHVVTLTWTPNRGTVVTSNGSELGVIEGQDFASALFAVWFGSNPVQTPLKEGMLGS